MITARGFPFRLARCQSFLLTMSSSCYFWTISATAKRIENLKFPYLSGRQVTISIFYSLFHCLLQQNTQIHQFVVFTLFIHWPNKYVNSVITFKSMKNSSNCLPHGCKTNDRLFRAECINRLLNKLFNTL